MRNKKIVSTAVIGLLFFCIIVSNVSADFSGISVGDAWTYTSTYKLRQFDDEVTHYTSVKVTSITSNTVSANLYKNGVLLFSDDDISQIYVFSDSVVSSGLNSTYNASYGGRTLVVFNGNYSGAIVTIDTATGILVEEDVEDLFEDFFEYITFKLTSWKLYKESPSISGFSWFFTILIIVGISTYLIRRGYHRIFIPNN